MPLSDQTDRRADTRSPRRLNVVGGWVAMLCAVGIGVANVTWQRPVVEQVCEPRPEPLPELCTTFRALTDSQWRSSLVLVLLVLWAISGGVAWRSWRRGQLVRTGPPVAFNQRGGLATLSFRRRIVSMTPGLLAAFSFAIRTGTSDQSTETVGPVCSTNDVGGVCRTSTVVVQQTVTTDLGVSPWPQAIAWMLVGATLCWWIYVVAAENLARRFGEANLWRAALRMRRESVPQYPAEQQRGNRY